MMAESIKADRQGIIITSFTNWQIFTGNSYETRNTQGVEDVKLSETESLIHR